MRTSASHIQNGNRTVDMQSLQRLASDGNFVPYQDIEKETVKVNSSTVRTTTRTCVRNRRSENPVSNAALRSLRRGDLFDPIVLPEPINPTEGGNAAFRATRHRAITDLELRMPTGLTVRSIIPSAKAPVLRSRHDLRLYW
jgi:hypothetical protein